MSFAMVKILGIVLLILAIVGVAYGASIVVEERNCYEKHRPTFEEIAFKTRARGWGESQVCEAQAEVISNLGMCLDEVYAKRHSLVKQYGSSYIHRVLSLLRPGLPDIGQLKREHSTNCQNYPQFLLDE